MAARHRRLALWDYWSFVAVRVEIARFGGILAGVIGKAGPARFKGEENGAG
jgi:hypothetical protein